MPIYRCNKCGNISELAVTPAGNQTACERCGTLSTVFDTVFYVEKLVERHFAALREVNSLRQQDKQLTGATGTDEDAKARPGHVLVNENLHNTALLASNEQHAPLKAWFAARQIEAKFDYSLVDTSGFFDEAARLIGERYALFSELVDRVRFAYRNSHSWINLELGALSQKDAQAINALCRQLYSHTFFAHYRYQKPEKIVRLTLQTANAVRQFFDGGWLEWYAFVELAHQLKARDRAFSCARGVKVIFANEDLHELDVVVLPEAQAPIFIECKSGEFRRDIEKYLRLRKRLGAERSRFIICAADLSDEQASGLSAMYELTFANLDSLGQQLQSLL